MVESQLGNKQKEGLKNEALPVLTTQPADTAERELILRQLFLLRQDVEFLKQLASPSQAPIGSVNTPLLDTVEGRDNSVLISEDSEYFIKNSSIGDMTIEDLEKEAIIRTLKFFKNNRRASAKSLGMSERTLYRKINFYGIERKIKNQ
jgi:DNA-binding NtrC family response regulator